MGFVTGTHTYRQKPRVGRVAERIARDGTRQTHKKIQLKRLGKDLPKEGTSSSYLIS